jgi:lysophospholipid acyltransferase (LPLAT)-like uncharacterized protein
VLVNWHVFEQLRRRRQAYLVGVWHNCIFCLMDLMGRERYPIIVSRSKDGEDIQWISARFGIEPVWGSASEGGPAALRQSLRLLRGGQALIVTPDGPRGPRYVLKPGIVALARKTGAPIVPLACSAARRWEFGSWDRMKLPKPFATLAVFVGDPIQLDPAEADEATHVRRVETALRELMLRAEAFTGAAARFPDPALPGAGSPPAPPAEAPPEAPPEGPGREPAGA